MSTNPPARGRRRARLIAGLGAATAVLATVALTGTASAAEDLVPGTPCARGTEACVQLGRDGFDGKAWLIRDGRVVRGPVHAATGGPGSDTPTGTFTVTRKERDHVSSETTNAEGAPSEMPWSVFFTDSGYAFHGGGDPEARTAGCIRLADRDASYFFTHLQRGDQVEVVGRSARAADDRHRGRHRDDRDDRDDNRDGGGLLGGL